MRHAHDRHLAMALGVATVGILLTSCASQPTACAGQCGPPYELDVSFRPTLTSTQAYTVLERCTDDPAVVRVDMNTLPGNEIQGRVFTTEIGTTPATTPLLTCLARQHEITGRGFPD